MKDRNMWLSMKDRRATVSMKDRDVWFCVYEAQRPVTVFGGVSWCKAQPTTRDYIRAESMKDNTKSHVFLYEGQRRVTFCLWRSKACDFVSMNNRDAWLCMKDRDVWLRAHEGQRHVTVCLWKKETCDRTYEGQRRVTLYLQSTEACDCVYEGQRHMTLRLWRTETSNIVSMKDRDMWLCVCEGWHNQ